MRPFGDPGNGSRTNSNNFDQSLVLDLKDMIDQHNFFLTPLGQSNFIERRRPTLFSPSLSEKPNPKPSPIPLLIEIQNPTNHHLSQSTPIPFSGIQTIAITGIVASAGKVPPDIAGFRRGCAGVVAYRPPRKVARIVAPPEASGSGSPLSLVRIVEKTPPAKAYASPESYLSPGIGKLTGQEVSGSCKELSPQYFGGDGRRSEKVDEEKENGMWHGLSGRFPSVSLFNEYQNAAMANRRDTKEPSEADTKNHYVSMYAYCVCIYIVFSMWFYLLADLKIKKLWFMEALLMKETRSVQIGIRITIPLQNLCHSIEQSPRSVNSKPAATPDRKSPKPASNPPDKYLPGFEGDLPFVLESGSVTFAIPVITHEISQAFFVTQTLRALARDGRTVITSIHQPSSEVFELFDQLYLLSGGKTLASYQFLEEQPKIYSFGFFRYSLFMIFLSYLFLNS
ncbi:hypothetical protein Ahy_B04g073486 isoform A [Arachis hypogaea]|uniref:ABC transporter family G domain-containing protein n=1 Tax=Arachis hypogaea TaxID=3818 RepID=A0A444ZQL1_ARAHY|nr:hypothetical protein Ahy_B04g073486 isoform A [Arachis hypogaea]